MIGSHPTAGSGRGTTSILRLQPENQNQNITYPNFIFEFYTSNFFIEFANFGDAKCCNAYQKLCFKVTSKISFIIISAFPKLPFQSSLYSILLDRNISIKPKVGADDGGALHATVKLTTWKAFLFFSALLFSFSAKR